MKEVNYDEYHSSAYQCVSCVRILVIILVLYGYVKTSSTELMRFTLYVILAIKFTYRQYL